MKNSLYALLLLVLVSGSLAIDRPPLYDYTGNGYNITCTNNPVYNTQTRAFVFGPSGNQKCDPIKNITTEVLPTNATPWTSLVKINMSAYTPTASSYHAKNIQFEFATDNGYSLRFEFNQTAGFRGQIVSGGTFNTGSYVSGVTTNTVIPIMYEFTGTNLLVWVNGSLSLNATSTGKSINSASPNNQLYGSGTGGGFSNGMFNGSPKDDAFYNRTLTTAERAGYWSKGTIPANPVYYLSYENTTTITGNLGATASGNMPTNSLGWHSELFLSNAPLIDVNNDGTLDTVAVVQEYYDAIELSGATIFREDMNLDVVCTWTGVNCTWQYTNALNSRNFSLHLSNYQRIANNGHKIVFILESVPQGLALNNSDCNYGVGSDWADCEPNNYSNLHIAVGNYIDAMVALAGQNGIFCIEIKNEPYLGQFFLPNASVTTQHRVARMLVWNDEMVSRLSVSHPWLNICGPSTTFGSSAAGWEFSQSFYSNRTFGSLNAPDYAAIHEYGSNGVKGIVRSNIESHIAFLNTKGYENAIVLTETLTNNNQVSQFEQERMEAEIANAYFGATLGGIQVNNVFRFSDTRPWSNLTTEFPAKYPQFYPTALGGPYYGGGFTAMQKLKELQTGATYYDCSTSDSEVTCMGTRSGNSIYVSFANMKGQQIDIETFTVTGETVLSVERLTGSQSASYSGDDVSLGLTNFYGVDTYLITVEAPPTSPSVIINGDLFEGLPSAGTQIGGFMSNLAVPIAYLVLVLAVVGMIVVTFSGIGASIRKRF